MKRIDRDEESDSNRKEYISRWLSDQAASQTRLTSVRQQVRTLQITLMQTKRAIYGLGSYFPPRRRRRRLRPPPHSCRMTNLRMSCNRTRASSLRGGICKSLGQNLVWALIVAVVTCLTFVHGSGGENQQVFEDLCDTLSFFTSLPTYA